MTSVQYIRKTHGGLNINRLPIPSTSYDNTDTAKLICSQIILQSTSCTHCLVIK